MKNIYFDRHGVEHIKPDDREGVERESACGVILRDGKILLLNSPGFTDWEFPGGKIEEGETLEQGLKREILEETGYKTTKVVKEFQQKEHHFYSREDQYFDSLAHFFIVEIDDSYQHRDKMFLNESEEVRWFDLDKLSLDQINPFHKSIIEELKKSKT